jgi:DNA-binding NtrC family response regulator
VLVAPSGSVALSIVRTRPVDVAVLDVKLPDIDGHDLFRRIREMKPEIPVVMLTGHATLQGAFQVSREGVFEYLAKPADVDDLARILRAAHSGRRDEAEPAAARPDAAPAEVGPPAPPEALDLVRVLLVDDEAEFIESMARVLRRRGMQVHTARDAVAGLAILQREAIDVAVVDIKMPGMDGIELFGRLRREGIEAEVILLTGHATVDSAVEGLKKGAFDYLLKPQDVDELAGKIRAAAARKRAREAEERARHIDDIIRRSPG